MKKGHIPQQKWLLTKILKLNQKLISISTADIGVALYHGNIMLSDRFRQPSTYVLDQSCVLSANLPGLCLFIMQGTQGVCVSNYNFQHSTTPISQRNLHGFSSGATTYVTQS